MSIITEIAKNYLIKIPAIKSIARRQHVTGVNQSDKGVREIVDLYLKHTDVDGKDVIELGPGHSWGVASLIKQAGAASVSIIDIEKYIPDSVLTEHDYLNYTIYSGGQMPFESEKFDRVFSYTVYEHLRHPETTIRETYRILRKGGVAVHMIDLGDHRYYGIDPAKHFDCLRYSRKTWDLMSRNRSVYVNRVQRSEWRKLHEEAGFTVVKEEPLMQEYTRALFEQGRLSYLSRLKPEDRFVSNLMIVVRK